MYHCAVDELPWMSLSSHRHMIGQTLYVAFVKELTVADEDRKVLLWFLILQAAEALSTLLLSPRDDLNVWFQTLVCKIQNLNVLC